MNYLKKLITEDTKILDLEDTLSISDNYKIEILGSSITECLHNGHIDGTKLEEIIDSMYLSQNNWYYFKENIRDNDYPFYLLDEFMGSYLAKEIDMKSVDYSVAHIGNKIGIASKNFKENGYSYYFLDYYQQEFFQKYGFGISNIDTLKSIQYKSYLHLDGESFLKHILGMLALDLYTLKIDRNPLDFQIQVSKETGDIDLAPLYDFSDCYSEIYEANEIFLKNYIVTLDQFNVSLLINKYPYFLECLRNLMETGMSATWTKICIDKHFNLDSIAYDEVLEYYEAKEEMQNITLRKIIREAPFYSRNN